MSYKVDITIEGIPDEKYEVVVDAIEEAANAAIDQFQTDDDTPMSIHIGIGEEEM